MKTKPAEEFAAQVLEKEMGKLLRESCKKTGQDRELNAIAGMPFTNKKRRAFRGFGMLDFEQKKAAAKILIKNIILTENEISIILR